jgi:hypothetical protein
MGRHNAGGIAVIAALLRAHQEADAVLGPLFTALHTFTDRMLEEFFWDSDLPHPVLSLQEEKDGSLGSYTRKDGYCLPHRINLNPYVLRTGEDAAETLIHELVHEWQDIEGQAIGHDDPFIAYMRVIGIQVDASGKHQGYTTGRWQAGLEESADLLLGKYLLPGDDKDKVE